MADPSIVRFREVVAAACAELESRRAEVNDLNVFPVADGDTGDNMVMTMRAVLGELDRLNGSTVDEIGREEMVGALARAALLGARGNSGVILSQIVRGAAEELASRPGELIDPVLMAAAFARAADAAYESVRDPAEGTMLSAIRAMAHRLSHDLAHTAASGLTPHSQPAEQDRVLAEALEGALEAGSEAVERGPERLAVLREAGVVDAGAYGLTALIAGVVAQLRGDDTPRLERQPVPAHALHGPRHESSEFRFCTNFAVTGEGLVGEEFVPALRDLGDSVLVVGDERTLRVHVHTDEPERAAALFEGRGEVLQFDAADMHEQVAAREARLGKEQPAVEQVTCRAVAVATGPGMRRLFEDLGAHVVEGGPTLNPSTHDLLAGIHEAAADEVLILPNSPNVLMAAERARELSEKPAHVVPTRSPQAALSALLALDPARTAAENADAVAGALDHVRTGGVAEAARDDAGGRFTAGEAVGYAEERLVAWGEPAATLAEVIRLLAEGSELITCIAGEGAPLEEAAVEALLPGGVEGELHRGGQPAWWWLLCAE